MEPNTWIHGVKVQGDIRARVTGVNGFAWRSAYVRQLESRLVGDVNLLVPLHIGEGFKRNIVPFSAYRDPEHNP